MVRFAGMRLRFGALEEQRTLSCLIEAPCAEKMFAADCDILPDSEAVSVGADHLREMVSDGCQNSSEEHVSECRWSKWYYFADLLTDPLKV